MDEIKIINCLYSMCYDYTVRLKSLNYPDSSTDEVKNIPSWIWINLKTVTLFDL